MWTWLENTFQNWHSEFLQMLVTVVLTTFLVHRHSHESADDQDEIKAQVEYLVALAEERKGA